MTSIQDRPADKEVLSAEQRPKYRETPEVTAATCRLIRSLGKRIATEDTPDLKLLGYLEEELEEAWQVAVAGLRQTGYTDGDIGRVLGITKQAVQQRWPRPS